jgi:hypothetical protein
MATKFLKDGQDFEFPSSFGFTGSDKGPNNPLPHPTGDGNEFGDGTYLARASEAEPTLARGGRVGGGAQRHPHMPHKAPAAAKAVLGALQLGAQIGQAKAAAGGVPPALGGQAPTISRGPMPPQMAMAMGGPVMRAHGGPADAKPAMHFDGGDHQYDSDGNAAEAAAAENYRPGEEPYRGPQAFAGGGKVAGDGATAGMNDLERSNFNNLKASKKHWGDADARYMATNPMGRLAPDPDTAKPTPRPTFGKDTMDVEYGDEQGTHHGEMDSHGNTSWDHGASILAPVEIGGSSNYNKSRVISGGRDPQYDNRAKGGFIKGAIKHPGALHKDLGVPQGQKIPAGKLAAAAKKSGKVGQRARFAETLRGLNKKD